MINYFLKRPMLFSGVICAIASILGYYYKFSILFIGAVSVAFLIWLILRNKSIDSKFIAVSLILVTLSLFLNHGKADTLNKHIGKTAESEFIVTDITYTSVNYNRANIEIIDSIILPKGVKLSVGYSDIDLSVGDVARGDIKLYEIEEDYRKSNYSNKIFINGSLKNTHIIDNSQDSVLKGIERIRNYIKNTLFDNLKYSNASTVCGIILGENRYFTDEFDSNIKASGVSHVMVVSGLHLSVFVAVATFLIERIFYNKYLRALLIATTVLFLIAVCGFTASMLRAGFTYFLMAIALLFDRKPVPENTLGAAVTIILIINPFIVLSVAFQLSVLATFGILSVSLPIIQYFRSRRIIENPIILTLFSAILTTLSATLLTMPVSIYAFGFISTVSLFTNLCITFAVNLVIWITVLALVVNLIFPAAAGLMFAACEPVTAFVNSVINEFGSIENAILVTPVYTLPIAVFIILLIFSVLLACKNRIDVLKLKEMRRKIIVEGGRKKNGSSF